MLALDEKFNGKVEHQLSTLFIENSFRRQHVDNRNRSYKPRKIRE
jgi:hypothetical protein